jgi:hypothetical protein
VITQYADGSRLNRSLIGGVAYKRNITFTGSSYPHKKELQDQTVMVPVALVTVLMSIAYLQKTVQMKDSVMVIYNVDPIEVCGY